MAIYSVFESPYYLVRWQGPDHFTNTFDVFEFKVGGKWKFIMRGPDGEDYPNNGEFSQLGSGSKIVVEHQCAPCFTFTVNLTPVATGTLASWEQVFSDVGTAQAVKSRARNANEKNLDRMTQVLANANFA